MDFSTMEEAISEKEAQLQYENSKLQDELNHLKDHTLSVEDTLTNVCFKLSQKENIIKSLEQQINSMCVALKEKEQLVELLEHEKGCIVQWKEKLISENLALKEYMKKHKLKNDEIEALKANEEELRNINHKLIEENSKLLTELQAKTEELSLTTESLKKLQLHIKELEGEKAELMAVRDTLLSREKEESLRILEAKESFLKKSPEWSKFSASFFGQGDQEPGNKDRVSTNLREEILEVEILEKQNRIGQLEKLLQEKEMLELERNNLTEKLKRKLDGLELSNCDWNTNFIIDSSAIYDIYKDLIRVLNWPEGQPNECKPLTEVASLAVVVKNGIQTTQPGSVRIVETVSIASQTDPIKNLSPVLFSGMIEVVGTEQNKSDSDDEEQEALQFLDDNNGQKTVQVFSEHKNCDLDMDMYRSCRKLSVLPEEDNDESFIRKSSLKNSSFKLKTHSADDVSQFKTVKLIFKESSYSNLISPENSKTNSKQCVLKLSNLKTDNIDNNSNKATENFTKTDNNKNSNNNNNELLLPTLSPKDVLRQPHSFDSYLNPPQTQPGSLTRQVSDPTQNTVFAPPITRRGSYIKRPRSTCRPLTLTCDKEDKKKEERICKVRFDLTHVEKGYNENKEPESDTVISNDRNVKIISRFRVEIVDEDEFRKSIEQQSTNVVASRKRPPLVHSVVYKQSVLRDITNLNSENETHNNNSKLKSSVSESPDSPTYDTATEGSPAESVDIDNSLILNDPHPLKKRKQSDSSCYSVDDSQDSSEGNNILINSIKLHSNSECIVMKVLSRESSDSSTSNTDQDIPYIDTEDLPVIKPSPEVLKTTVLPEILFPEKKPPTVQSPGSISEDSDPYLTPCDVTPVSESDTLTIGAPKPSTLSKSPTVLKNLANFEILSTITESRKIVSGQISEEDETKEQNDDAPYEEVEEKPDKQEKLTRTSSDMSETSESDTLTYGTVKSHLQLSSDGDSDTYVTVWSDKSSGLERKFSDFSENSSSPYNTPPDTSSASFCTPPDNYSPVLGLLKKMSVEKSTNSPEIYSVENKWEDFSGSAYKFNNPLPSNSSFEKVEQFSKEREVKTDLKNDILFDSPKLEFYETNDSVENLESFLQSEEGLTEYVYKEEAKERRNSDNWLESRFLEMEEEVKEAKRDSLESVRPSDRRGKKHPPLSRQNSTEDFNFLDHHDSCLNLSEEVSSPSTTPDTSNKTVIMRSIPLTVSNTIDLEDEDFPISEAEIQVNVNESRTDILDIILKGKSPRKIQEDVHYHSEPCTPSISSPADFPEFTVIRKQRSSFNDESLMCGKFDTNLPEIIVSNLSSESDNSDSEIPDLAATDFASNVSDRSEVHLSDVKSISGISENCNSSSEHSDNIISDVFSSDSDKSSAISPEVSQNSSSPLPSDKTPPLETSQDNEENVNLNSDALCYEQIETGNELRASDGEIVPGATKSVDVFSEGTRLTNEASFQMSKRSDTSFSGIEELGENSSMDSSEGSSDVSANNSRDVNLNSKKFADCNLVETLPVRKSSMNSKKENFEEMENKKALRKTEKSKSIQDINLDSEGCNSEKDNRKNSNVVVNCSTPIPESAGCQALTNLFSVGSDVSSTDNVGQTFVVANNNSSQSSALTDEEIGKKFQDLSFAFKTDSLTIQNRLQLMKRRRDQAEFNIENELKTIKAKLKNLQVLGLSSEYVNLMSDLRKQLDFVLNASVQLSSSAESYGYAQHEERLLDFVTVMLQHVENVESLKNEASKILEKLKLDGTKFQAIQGHETDADCDKILRRRLLPPSSLGISSRRRASIATLPGISGCNSEDGKDQWTPSRHVAGIGKKLSFSQASSSKSIPASVSEEGRRESNFGRQKLETRDSESSIKSLNEFRDQLNSAVNSEPAEDEEDEGKQDVSDSSLHLRSLFDSIEDIRQGSGSQDGLDSIYYIKKLVELNKLALSATRFRWPDNVLQYVPFYITWYVVFILALVFVGGLFTGINGCYTYSCLKFSHFGVAAIVLFSVARQFYRFLLPLVLTVAILTVLFLLWLTKIILPRLTDREVDSLFKTLGLEVTYPYGPPPV